VQITSGGSPRSAAAPRWHARPTSHHDRAPDPVKPWSFAEPEVKDQRPYRVANPGRDFIRSWVGRERLPTPHLGGLAIIPGRNPGSRRYWTPGQAGKIVRLAVKCKIINPVWSGTARHAASSTTTAAMTRATARW
jgi:hypothetical protein